MSGKAIKFKLDGKEVEARDGETIRICAGATSRATAPTATAAPAWSRSRASGRWRPPASASRPTAWW
jgi:hypothetical protein